MDKKATIKVSRLVLDYNIYPRHEVDAYHVGQMVESLAAGKTLPPVLVDKVSLRVVDGFHRLMAVRRVNGPDAEMACVIREYASEAELFSDAVRLNSSHGRALTVYDKVRCLSVGSELGIDKASLAADLNITLEKAEGLLETRTASKGEALKYTMRHLAGERLTRAQTLYNETQAGGLDQLFYINQVVNLLESNSTDWDREKVVQALRRLSELLVERLGALQHA